MSQQDNTHINSELVSWGITSKWKVVKLKFLIKSIQTGSTPSTNDDDYYDGDINWFTPGDYTESMYLINSHKKITEKAILDKEVRVLPKDTVAIVGIGATLGKVAILSHESSFNQQVTGLITNDLILPEYLYYWLQINKDTLIKTANYTTLPIINNQFIKEFNCVLPDIRIQIQIVDYLNRKCDEISNIVESKENLIRLLEEKRQAIITEAVTKGLNPNVKMKDSGVEWIGEIPEHWIISQLKFLADDSKHSFVDGPFGSDLKNEEYVEQGVPVIQLNNIRNGQLRLTNINFVTVEKAQVLNRHTAFPGDLVIAKMASPVARSALVTNDFEKYVIVADCIKLKLKSVYNNEFINYAINTPHVIAQAEAFANGTTRTRVNLGIVKNLKVVIAPYEEQVQIVNYLKEKLSNLDKISYKVTAQIEKLKEYRQSLIYEAVTGKIDVRDIEIDS